MNFDMATLGFKKAKLRQQTGQTFPKEFPISFKPKVAIAEFLWRMQRKTWHYEKWGGRQASFPLR